MVVSSAPPTGDLAPDMYLDWELNWRHFVSQAGIQSTEPHKPGLHGIFVSDKTFHFIIIIHLYFFITQHRCFLLFLHLFLQIHEFTRNLPLFRLPSCFYSDSFNYSLYLKHCEVPIVSLYQHLIFYRFCRQMTFCTDNFNYEMI